MRSILLHIHDDDCLEARFQAALEIARLFGGHVTCLQAMPFELGVPGDLYGMAAIEVLPDIRERADALRARIEARLANEDVAWDWIQEDTVPTEQLLRRSGLGDLIVLGSCDPTGANGPSFLAGNVVLQARTPVLLVPPATRRLNSAGTAVVAWDGSLEAARALRSASFLLAKASTVALVTLVDKSHRAIDLPATEGAKYLSRHGVACEMIELPRGGGSVAQGLARAAASREAAYLVMGAYGHSRILETIWGGVTRELFAAPPLPIFACH